MEMSLPKIPCWNCPEGNYSATCSGARIVTEKKNGKPTQFLLLVFEIDAGDEENVQNLAKRKYELPIKHGSPLMNDLTAWIGPDVLRNNRALNLALFEGKKADVSLVHIYNEGYDKPWVHIQTISAPGSLTDNS